MPEYKPALNEVENKRIDELMEKLKKVQNVEDEIKRELRKLIYKADRR